jgi:hypothetical protein
MLSVANKPFMLNVIMLSVVMVSVVAPLQVPERPKMGDAPVQFVPNSIVVGGCRNGTGLE